MSVTTLPNLDQLEKLKATLLKPYQVVIHDDPIHTYHDVAHAVQVSIPGKSYTEGWDIATIVDTTGSAIATTCPKEQAEYYREILEVRHGLTSTIRPA